MAFGLAAYVSRCRLPSTAQGSLPGAGQAPLDGLDTRRVPTKGLQLTSCASSSFSKLLGTTPFSLPRPPFSLPTSGTHAGLLAARILPDPRSAGYQEAPKSLRSATWFPRSPQSLRSTADRRVVRKCCKHPQSNRLSEDLPCNFGEFLSRPVGRMHGGRQLERGPVRRPPLGCFHSSRGARCGNVQLSTPGQFFRYLRKAPLT